MEVFNRIRAILIRQLSLDEKHVTLTSRIREDLKASDLDLLELIMAFEDEFGCEISAEETNNFKTVSQLVDFLLAWENQQTHENKNKDNIVKNGA